MLIGQEKKRRLVMTLLMITKMNLKIGYDIETILPSTTIIHIMDILGITENLGIIEEDVDFIKISTCVNNSHILK